MGLNHQVYNAAKRHTEVLDNIVGSVSNVHTIGYKKVGVDFAQTLDGEVVKVKKTNFSQGPLRRTGEPYDFAIKGKGFFEVELPDGRRAYTRMGRFELNKDGELVTPEGYRILPKVEGSQKGGPVFTKSGDNTLGVNLQISSPKLILPANLSADVKEDGTIYAINKVSGEKKEIGKLNLVVFNNPQGLESQGQGYYLETSESGHAHEIKVGMNEPTQIKQGFVEYSNVDIASTFMDLSKARNILSAEFKALKAIDKIYENIHYTISRNA